MAKHSIDALASEAKAQGLRGVQVTKYVRARIVAESNRREQAARGAEEGR